MASPASSDTPHCHAFNDTDADIILRSSDCIDFRVHKIIMAKASPIYADMFDMPQPPACETADPDDGEVAVVDLAETSSTLEALLSYCYPMDDPELSELQDIQLVLEAARKYEMVWLTARASATLALRMYSEPFGVFAIAYDLRLYDIIRSAALHSLREPLLSNIAASPEFTRLTASAFQAIIKCRIDCVAAAVARVDDCLSHDGYIWFSDQDLYAISMHTKTVTPPISFGPLRKSVVVCKWWSDYIAVVRSLLKEKPVGASVTEASILAEAFNAASECSVCKSESLVDLQKFSLKLAKEINSATVEVMDNYDFEDEEFAVV